MSTSEKVARRRADNTDAYDAREITDWDHKTYFGLVSADLSEEQQARITRPQMICPRQSAVLAVHWHPEFVPMSLIRKRIDVMFPNRGCELIIPTQHNILMSYDDYAGVEVDSFSASFNRKVQLLCHFEASRVEQADVFRAMLAHTFRYRSRQLFEFIDAVVEPAFADRLERAVDRAGVDEGVIDFVQTHTRKLKELLFEHEAETPVEAIRNKIVFHYFHALREHYDERLIHRAEVLLREVKRIVKRNFGNESFYATEKIIEEVRGLNGGVVVPHPEQFWPILLADYDVDGYEVWNPQSQEYTEFLITVVTRQNKARRRTSRPILIFMGDDCHMGEKTREPAYQNPEKSGREVGVQPAWDDLSIRKSLIIANASRVRVIEDYRARLS